MSEVLRVRFHGRGGQGMKTASRMLGSAAFRAGFEVQDSPTYGAERCGAPMAAYIRIGREPVLERGAIEQDLKAKAMKGPKLFLAHAPCPTGWLYDPEETLSYSRLAVDIGIFALKEAVHGEITHTVVPKRRRPVEDYLAGQGRDRHLFEPERNEPAIQRIQEHVDRYWDGVMR